MSMIGKVKRMYFREKKSVREIVRLTSLSRNTVRKWLKTPVLEEPRYRRSETPCKLAPFHDAIKQALKVDAHRPRHERRTARALHAQIKSEGYAGSYSRVTDFVRAWRQGEGERAAQLPTQCPMPNALGGKHVATENFGDFLTRAPFSSEGASGKLGAVQGASKVGVEHLGESTAALGREYQFESC